MFHVTVSHDVFTKVWAVKGQKDGAVEQMPPTVTIAVETMETEIDGEVVVKATVVETGDALKVPPYCPAEWFRGYVQSVVPPTSGARQGGAKLN